MTEEERFPKPEFVNKSYRDGGDRRDRQRGGNRHHGSNRGRGGRSFHDTADAAPEGVTESRAEAGGEYAPFRISAGDPEVGERFHDPHNEHDFRGRGRGRGRGRFQQRERDFRPRDRDWREEGPGGPEQAEQPREEREQLAFRPRGRGRFEQRNGHEDHSRGRGWAGRTDGDAPATEHTLSPEEAPEDRYHHRGGRGHGTYVDRGRGRGQRSRPYDAYQAPRFADGDRGVTEDMEQRQTTNPPPPHFQQQREDQPPRSQKPPGRVVRAPRLQRNNFDLAEVDALFGLRHNQKGISFANYEVAVELTPNDVEAATSFQEFDVHPLLTSNIQKCGYEAPTPVQKFGIPVCLAGQDLMACAQTGSGKTAAFLVPIVQHILVHGVSPMRDRRSYPIALIMSPTRELALQIYDESRKLAYQTDIFCDVMYGGMAYPQRFEQDILVACPGRLKDVYDNDRLSFEAIKFLVLDEADRMLEMGFEEQIEYLVSSTFSDMPPPAKRQTLMFSATFPKPILELARKYLRNKYYLLTVGRVGSTTRNITQSVKFVTDNRKQETLLRHLTTVPQGELCLIFVETKREAEDLYVALHQQGLKCATIHGDRKQWEREEALKKFKESRVQFLVATDVASRGLDIPDVTRVIQYDMAQTMDEYTHRIGRTGRAGNIGEAIAFFNEHNSPLATELVGYLQEHDQDVPEWLEHMKQDQEFARTTAPAHRRGDRRGGRGGRGSHGGHGRGARASSELPDSWEEEAQQGHRQQHRGHSKGGNQAPDKFVDDGGF